MNCTNDVKEYLVALYYKYICMNENIRDDLINKQNELCTELGLTGRIRIATEGINGTISGLKDNVYKYIKETENINSINLKSIDWKLSHTIENAFPSLQIRKCNEIVSLTVPINHCSPFDKEKTGIQLNPNDFHELALTNKDNSLAIIDVRNMYEYSIGHFKDAINPKTRKFGEFPKWCQDNIKDLEEKDKILMYCTGGIRCEKASAYLKHLGLKNVYQLNGGIHRYLEAFPDGGLFKGKNFVFDQRIVMSSEDKEIIGKCELCSKSTDSITGLRCEYCRSHILLCENCTEINKKENKSLFCPEHQEYNGTIDTLQEKKNNIEKEILSKPGLHMKSKRRSLRKRLDFIEKRIETLNLIDTIP